MVSFVHIYILEIIISCNLHNEWLLRVLDLDDQPRADYFLFAVAIEIDEVIGWGDDVFIEHHLALCNNELVYI